MPSEGMRASCSYTSAWVWSFPLPPGDSFLSGRRDRREPVSRLASSLRLTAQLRPHPICCPSLQSSSTSSDGNRTVTCSMRGIRASSHTVTRKAMNCPTVSHTKVQRNANTCGKGCPSLRGHPIPDNLLKLHVALSVGRSLPAGRAPAW
jgi:hypothetical protein